MPTRTKPQQSSRIGRRATPPPQGRFNRPSRPTPRKPAAQSNSDKAMAMVTGALSKPSGKKKASASGGKGGKAGRMALLAGGLGLAMKNRSKLTGMLQRRHADKAAAQSAQPAPPPPPPAV